MRLMTKPPRGEKMEPIFGAPKTEPATVEEAAQNAIDEATAAREEGQERRPDPAPLPSHVARDRAFQLIDNIGSATGLQLRQLRDQIDDLTREMNERRDMIRDAIVGYAEFAETAMVQKQIISEAIDNLRTSFEASQSALPPTRRVQ